MSGGIVIAPTPGPWSIGETYTDPGEAPETVIRALDGRAAVAVALDFGENNPGMRAANAALIAAAPELLAALELVLTFMHPDHPAKQQARAAIVKAHGLEPVAGAAH